MAEKGNPDSLTDIFAFAREREYPYEAPQSGASSTSTGADFSENDDFTLSNSDQYLLHAAAVAQNGESASFILPAAQQTDAANPNSEAGKRKREEHRKTQLTIAEQAQRLSAQLAAQIAALEADLLAEHGDAWREIIANKVMDEVPERRDGESMADYRQRLETALIAQMIDQNGNIRPEYANDPETARYAEWAQARHRQNELASTPPEQMQEFLAENADWTEVQTIEQNLQTSGSDNELALERSATLRDQSTEPSAEGSFFTSSPGG